MVVQGGAFAPGCGAAAASGLMQIETRSSTLQ
jgi:hypothetical protein